MWLILCMSRARIDLLATKEQFQQLSETLKHEPDHISEALREVRDQLMKATEDQSKESDTAYTYRKIVDSAE